LSPRPRPIHALLAGGLLLFVLGAFNVVRHNREVDANATEADAQRARYARVVRNTAERPPRFEVSLVQFRLSDLDRLTRPASDSLRYEVVDLQRYENEVVFFKSKSRVRRLLS